MNPDRSGGLTARDLFAPTIRPDNTRDRLILTAMNLFYEHGIHAVGLDRILADVGVTKTTFYNHFESKDALVYEVMDRREQWEFETWSAMVDDRAGPDPRARLLAIFDVLDLWFNDARYRGCMFINAAAEFPAMHDPAHEVARRHVRRFRRRVRDLADAAGADDPDAFAARYVLLIQGAIVVRQVTGDDRAAADARATTRMLIQRHMPPIPDTPDPKPEPGIAETPVAPTVPPAPEPPAAESRPRT